MKDGSAGKSRPRGKTSRSPIEPAGRYAIGEVVDLTGIPPRQLRLWERRVPDLLAPSRTAGGQRRYSDACLERIRVLDRLVNQEGLSFTGARRRIEESRGAAEGGSDLVRRLLGDKRVKQAIEELVSRIKKRILEIAAEE